MANIKKVKASNHLPSKGDGRFPVYSKQFNEAVDEIESRLDNLEDGTISADTISEKTAGSGVTVDSTLIKDGGVLMDDGTITQATSITTGVTLNKPAGVITTVSAATAAGGSDTFTLTNSFVAATSVIHAWIIDYAGTFTTNGLPIVSVDNRGAGTVNIVLSNAHSANALNGVVKIGFAILG